MHNFSLFLIFCPPLFVFLARQTPPCRRHHHRSLLLLLLPSPPPSSTAAAANAVDCHLLPTLPPPPPSAIALHCNCPLPMPLQRQRVLLAPCDNNDDDNKDDNKEDLVWFANNASLTLSCLRRHVGRPTNMAAALASAAANASS